MKEGYDAMRKILLVIIIICVTIAGCVYYEQKNEHKAPKDLLDEGSMESNGDSPSAQPKEDKKLLPQDILKGTNSIVVDKPIEDFVAVDLNGKKIKLSDFQGKIVFLNFWGTWCPPCRAEMPAMEEFYNEYKDKDVVILVVSSTTVELQGGKDAKTAEKNVRSFIEENGYTFPVILDKENKGWAIYRQSGVPTNYIIDKKGMVRYLKIGGFSGKEEMERFVQAIEAME